VSFEGICPHCGQPTRSDDTPDGIVDCVHCDRSFGVPLPADASPPSGGDAGDGAVGGPQAPPAALGDGPARGSGRAGRSDVPMSTTGLLAAVLTTVFYLAVVRPLQETYFGQLFAERGWVPYVISFLSFWALALLAGKYSRLRRQSQVLALDLLPRSIGKRITPANAPAFSGYVLAVAPQLGAGFLLNRVHRALEHFSTRARVQETVELLRNQAESDEAVVESSYTMLRVFIWAIPILGFIGTVLGIGASVGGFSESVGNAANLDVMKDSIGTVTTGLGVAFDTTLLALVMSVLIMFPTSSLQKAEEDLLARIEDYCGRHLIARLDDGDESEPAAAADEKLLRQVVARLADELTAELERRLPRER